MSSNRNKYSIGQRISKWMLASSVVRVIERRVNDPFKDNSAHVIIHTVHHKIGTNWFRSVLRNISDDFGIPMVRDVVLSAYHYHLWTDEEWTQIPMKELPGDREQIRPLLGLRDLLDMSYPEYLKSVSLEEYILIEMKRCSTTSLKEIVEWNYGGPNIFEFKYEDIMLKGENIFRQIFKHYGFKDVALIQRTAR